MIDNKVAPAWRFKKSSEASWDWVVLVGDQVIGRVRAFYAGGFMGTLWRHDQRTYARYGHEGAITRQRAAQELFDIWTAKQASDE